mmetsp:Transcript_112350/g.194853  ORF Transcript_112350/g.194853 Transcript_112350/m.194853 type:complete len:215 (-) Transcript_112350:222-866(-)
MAPRAMAAAARWPASSLFNMPLILAMVASSAAASGMQPITFTASSRTKLSLSDKPAETTFSRHITGAVNPMLESAVRAACRVRGLSIIPERRLPSSARAPSFASARTAAHAMSSCSLFSSFWRSSVSASALMSPRAVMAATLTPRSVSSSAIVATLPSFRGSKLAKLPRAVTAAARTAGIGLVRRAAIAETKPSAAMPMLPRATQAAAWTAGSV